MGFKVVRLILGFLLVISMTLAGLGYDWLNRPMDMPAQGVDLAVEAGTSSKEVVGLVIQAGVNVDAEDPAIRVVSAFGAGQADTGRASYELDTKTTPQSLLTKLVQGDEALRSVTLVEGWNFRQVLAALQKADALQSQAALFSPQDLMARLGRARGTRGVLRTRIPYAKGFRRRGRIATGHARHG